MKRIIDMLLKMIWPALVSFILLIAESFVLDCQIVTIHRLAAEGNTVTETLIKISDSIVVPSVIILTILAVVVFTAMFITGFIWNIVYSINHKDE